MVVRPHRTPRSVEGSLTGLGHVRVEEGHIGTRVTRGRLVRVELVIKLGDIPDSRCFLSLLERREWGMGGDGVDDAVAWRTRQVVPVTLSIVESCILHRVCSW